MLSRPTPTARYMSSLITIDPTQTCPSSQASGPTTTQVLQLRSGDAPHNASYLTPSPTILTIAELSYILFFQYFGNHCYSRRVWPSDQHQVGVCSEHNILGPTPDLLTQDLHFNKIPSGFIYI